MAGRRVCAVLGACVLFSAVAMALQIDCSGEAGKKGIMLDSSVSIGADNHLVMGGDQALCIASAQVVIMGAFGETDQNRGDGMTAGNAIQVVTRDLESGEDEACVARGTTPSDPPRVCGTGKLKRPDGYAQLQKVVVYGQPMCNPAPSSGLFPIFDEFVPQALEAAYHTLEDTERKVLALQVPGNEEACECKHCKYIPYTIALVKQFLSNKEISGTTVVLVFSGKIGKEVLEGLHEAAMESGVESIRSKVIGCTTPDDEPAALRPHTIKSPVKRGPTHGCEKFHEVVKRSASTLTSIPEYPYLIPATYWKDINVHVMQEEYDAYAMGAPPQDEAKAPDGQPARGTCVPWKNIVVGGIINRIEMSKLQGRMALASSSDVADCIGEGHVPIISFPVETYVNATDDYQISVRRIMETWRNALGAGESKFEDANDNEVGERTVEIFLNEFFESTLVGPKSHVRKQLHEWFRHVAMVAHEHPGVLRAFRRNLGGMLKMIQAWQLRWASDDYKKKLTPKEIDEILNVKAPSKFGHDACEKHLGGNIGDDPSAILQVIRNGNLREMAALVTAGLDCEAPEDGKKEDMCFKEIMFDIAEALYGKAKPGKSKDLYVEIEDREVEQYDAYAPPTAFKSMLDIDPVARQAMIQFIKDSGIEINMHLLWQQYQRVLFGDKMFLANPNYDEKKCQQTPDPTYCKERKGYHLLGFADLDPSVVSPIYKKKIWTPRPGWVLASRLPGVFTIRDKPTAEIISFRMNPLSTRGSAVSDGMHPAIWQWKDIFDYGGVAFVSRRERNKMLQCKNKQPVKGSPDSMMAAWIKKHTRLSASITPDERWSAYNDDINDEDRCPWNSGATYNVMKNIHYPMFSPKRRLSYAEVSEMDLGGVDAGPSGTTDETMLTMALMNGNTNDLFATRLGMIGYLVPYHHHTWLEVLQGASGYGLYYRKESPSNDLLPAMGEDSIANFKGCADFALHNPMTTQNIDKRDNGMGTVGGAFDRLVAMWAAKTQVRQSMWKDPNLTIDKDASIWFDQRIGLSVQLHDPSYTLSSEGAVFYLCHLSRERKIDHLLPDRIIRKSPECQYLEKLITPVQKDGMGLPQAACALQKTLRDDDGEPAKDVGDPAKEINDLDVYFDSRAYICYQAHKMYAMRTTHFKGNSYMQAPIVTVPHLQPHDETHETLPRDYAFGELLSLCNGIRRENKEWDGAWPMVANTIFLRDLNALLTKISPRLTDSVYGLKCDGGAATAAGGMFMTDRLYDELKALQMARQEDGRWREGDPLAHTHHLSEAVGVPRGDNDSGRGLSKSVGTSSEGWDTEMDGPGDTMEGTSVSQPSSRRLRGEGPDKESDYENMDSANGNVGGHGTVIKGEVAVDNESKPLDKAPAGGEDEAEQREKEAERSIELTE